LQQIVKDYRRVVAPVGLDSIPFGNSDAPKGVVFHVLDDNSVPVDVLDIGFGDGSLGWMVRSNPETSHWSIDGIDGFLANCHAPALIEKAVYRNIWHGLAQEIAPSILAGYRIICLLDVIEHLPADEAKSLLECLLRGMGDDASLIVSTPMYFYHQQNIQEGDLEEHLIGVPVTSMMALIPKMYAIHHDPFVGGFVLTKESLDFIEFFQPTTNKGFSQDQGLAIARSIRLPMEPDTVYQLR